MNYWLKIGLVFCAIWAIAAGAIYLARSAKPTAQSVAAYVHANDINSKNGNDRKKEIDRVTAMMNQLSLDERQELRRDRVTEDFFRSLTPDEQAAYLDATLPTGFKQMMESFNKMDPAKRKEIVDRALVEMKKHQGEQPKDVDQKNVQKIVDQGLRSFYSDANADVKLDLAPLIEQMQQNLQSPPMKNAFTLIELLVVVVIIALLAGITVPVYQHVIQGGRATACVSNLRQLGIALNLYLNEHNATMPPLAAGRTDKSQNVPVIDNTLNTYADNPNIFACPADIQGIAATTGTSYYWNSALSNQALSNLNFLAIADMSRIPILSDKEGFHPYTQNKVNILYADGHASKDLQFFTSP